MKYKVAIERTTVERAEVEVDENDRPEHIDPDTWEGMDLAEKLEWAAGEAASARDLWWPKDEQFTTLHTGVVK